MGKFNEVVSDFLTVLNNLQYDDREKRLIKIELFLNIRKLTESYKHYKDGISILNNIMDEAEEIETNTNFNEVIFDYFNTLVQTKYDDREKNLIKTELVMNLSRLTESYDYYRMAISVLSENEKTKKRKKKLVMPKNK